MMVVHLNAEVALGAVEGSGRSYDVAALAEAELVLRVTSFVFLDKLELLLIVILSSIVTLASHRVSQLFFCLVLNDILSLWVWIPL